MDSSLLKVFVSVAENGSLSGAAKELHYVQSNITARVKQLEDYLQRKLFHRKPRGVVLTDAGERLFAYAKDIVKKMEEAEAAVRNLDETCGRLRIASTESNSATRLAPILNRIHRKYPKIDLELFTGHTGDVSKMLLDYKVDVAFISGAPEHPDLKVLKSFEEEMVLIEPVSSNAENVVLAFKKGCTYRRYLEEHMKQSGIYDYRVMEFGSLETIMGCVSAGMGKTFLPLRVAEKYSSSDIKFSKLSGEYSNIPTHVVCLESALPLIDIDLILEEI